MPDDQARGLRAIFGGAAGPGVTVALCGNESARIATQLACAIGALGQRVLLIDRTRGEAAAAFGVKARYDLQHALQRHRRIAEVIVPVTPQVTLLPAARGLDAIAITSEDWRRELERRVPALSRAFDVWVLNGPLPAAAPDARVLLAVAPTARAITAAYGHIKALAQAQGCHRFGVVVHRARTPEAARKVFDCVAETAGRFLAAELEFMGYVPRDNAPGRPIVAARGASPGAAFMTIARAVAAGSSQGA
jgi:flagellar biosynthesis protein FlhG